VVRFGGSPNKNIGEAFLLVWKIAERIRDVIELEMYIGRSKIERGKLTMKNKQRLNIESDFSTLSIIKIFAGINSLDKILCYKKNDCLQ
jgi:hypothetical protein